MLNLLTLVNMFVELISLSISFINFVQKQKQMQNKNKIKYYRK